jgi:hypothetical protein
MCSCDHARGDLASGDWIPAPDKAGLINKHEWVSPTNHNVYVDWTSDRNTYMLAVYDYGVKKEVADVDAYLDSEHLGIGGLPQRVYMWLGPDLLAFKDLNGVGVLDVGRARFLINNAFQSFVQLPGKFQFVFVPVRPAPRHGTFNYLAFKDKIGLINLAGLNVGSASLDMWSHIAQSNTVNGVFVSPLALNKQNSVVALILSEGHIHAVKFDSKTLNIVKDVKVDAVVPTQILEYGGIDSSLISQFKHTLDEL